MQTDYIARKELEKSIPFFDIFNEVSIELDTKIYFVGGLVRDFFLQKSSIDIDIVPIGKSYEEVAKALQRKIKCIGIPFKDNIRLVKGKVVIDVSAPRGETIEEDLLKRDFTINNLAIDNSGAIYGKADDIQNRLIRSVHSENIIDDPLRILRAFRFISQLGFDLERVTAEDIRAKKQLLMDVAVERIFDEIKKLMLGSFFSKSFNLLSSFEVLTEIIPELSGLKGIGFSKYHSKDAYDHTIDTVLKMHQIAKLLKLTDDKYLILVTAMLLHDIGKSDAEYVGKKNFIGHEAISMKMAEKILIKLNYPKKIMKEILLLIKDHTQLRIYASNGVKDKTLMKYIYKHKDLLDEHVYMFLADNCVKECDMSPLHQVILKMKEILKLMNFENIKLISGKDLIQLGIKPGPEMKDIINDIHFQLASNIITNKEDAQKYITNNYI